MNLDTLVAASGWKPKLTRLRFVFVNETHSLTCASCLLMLMKRDSGIQRRNFKTGAWGWGGASGAVARSMVGTAKFFFGTLELTLPDAGDSKRKRRGGTAAFLQDDFQGGSGDVEGFAFCFVFDFIVDNQIADAVRAMIVAVIVMPERKSGSIPCGKHHHFFF